MRGGYSRVVHFYYLDLLNNRDLSEVFSASQIWRAYSYEFQTEGRSHLVVWRLYVVALAPTSRATTTGAIAAAAELHYFARLPFQSKRCACIATTYYSDS